MSDNLNEINKTVQKKKNNKKLAIFSVITLSVLLIVSIVLGVSGAYFQDTRTATGEVSLGDPVTISIYQGGAAAATLTFGSDAMPGDVYTQPISVYAPADTSDAVLRAKLTITNTGGTASPVVATTTDDWLLHTDEYYYYNGVLSATNTIDFITDVTVPTTLTNDDANKTNTIAVVVEAIQHANAAATEVWTTAPTDWLTTYGNG